MTTRHTISLPEQMSQYITKQIDSGKFASISDYVRSLIRSDQKQKENAIEELKLLLQQGENSDFGDYHFEEILALAKKQT